MVLCILGSLTSCNVPVNPAMSSGSSEQTSITNNPDPLPTQSSCQTTVPITEPAVSEVITTDSLPPPSTEPTLPVDPPEPERWDPTALVGDRMPTLSIQTTGGQSITSKTEYITATVSAEGAPEEFCFSDLSAQIRCRGNYTYKFAKKSYRLKFDEKINLFGQDEGKAKNWCLLANGPDRSLLRNDTAFAMASVLTNLREFSSSGFVRLVVNGRDRGVYQLLEQHSVSSHRIDIDEQPDVLDSDYLLELDSYAEGVENVDYFIVGKRKYVIKNDEIHPDAMEFLKQTFQDAFDAVQLGDENAVSALLDIDSFVDLYILQEFALNVDAGWSSFFMVKDAGGKIRLTWPWDFDIGFGNDYRLGNAPVEGLYAGNSAYSSWSNSNPWFYLLMQQQWFVDRVIARWNEVGKEMTQTGIARIDLVYGSFGEDLAYNYTIWNNYLGKPMFPIPDCIARLTDYGEIVSQLRDWVERRFLWLDEYWNDDSRCYGTVTD